jgi:hypothetical protein
MAREQIKKMGMDRMTIIVRPDKHLHYMIFPNLEAYVQTLMTPEEIALIDKRVALAHEVSEQGTETIDGHPCVKHLDIVRHENKKETRSIIWTATDLRNFPVQIEITEQGRTNRIRFLDVKLLKPDPYQFEPPVGYKKYADMGDLMLKSVLGH